MSGKAAAGSDGGALGRLVVEKPQANSIAVVSLDHVVELVLNFSLRDVKITVLDVDMVLLFPDGAKIILPGFALAVVAATAPEITSTDGAIEPQKFLTLVGETQLSDQMPSLTLTSVPQQQSKTGGPDETAEENATGPGEADPIPVASPPRPAEESEEEASNDDGPGEADPVRVHVIKTETFSDTSSSSSTASSDKDDDAPVVPTNPNTGDSKAAVLAIQLLGIGRQSVEEIPGKGLALAGGASHEAAETDPSFETQMRAESLRGTSGDDVIHADDPAITPEGTSARLLDGHVTMPDASWKAVAAIVYGLPEGYWSGENMAAAWRSDLNLSIRQLVYDFGATASDVARAQVTRQSETLRAQDAREEVALKVAETYVRILERREMIGVASDHVAALKRILTMLDENQKAGNGTLADTKRVRARLIDAQTMQADAEADLASAVDRFERYVARPPNRLAPAPLLVRDLPASVDDALVEVTGANPALLAGHAAVKAARHELDSQDAAMLPRLQVESDTAVKEFLGEKDHTDVDARVMLALRYKLTDGGLQRSQADQLSAKLVQAELRLRDAEDEIETSLRDSFRALATARGKADHLRQGVADSRRARQLYDEQFRGAKRTILELLDVQSAYFQARQAEIANKYVEHRATYAILRDLGRLARSAAARG